MCPSPIGDEYTDRLCCDLTAHRSFPKTLAGFSSQDRSGELPNSKELIRRHIWYELERQGLVPVPPGAYGRIPYFMGATAASDWLARCPQWREARTVKANPDRPQLPVRLRALREGKRLYMAVPAMKSEKPFVFLDPARLRDNLEEAASSDAGVRLGQLVAVEEVEPIDLVVCGTVAVNRKGARLGKGSGFSDIEVALLVETGAVTRATTIATTVHDLQVVDDEIPETEHDFRVDLIATPTTVIEVPGPRRRPRIYWDDLDKTKIEAIPVLAKMREEIGH